MSLIKSGPSSLEFNSNPIKTKRYPSTRRRPHKVDLRSYTCQTTQSHLIWAQYSRQAHLKMDPKNFELMT